MSSIPSGRKLTGLILTSMLLAACATASAQAATRTAPRRAAQSASSDLDRILRENALFFNMLVSFSYTAAISSPEWGLGVSDINVNLITRNVRDPGGHQLIRVRVAGAVRKNSNVELNLLDPTGKLVGKEFLGYKSGQLIFYNPADKPIITGTLYSNGTYFLDDLRLPQGNQSLAGGHVDPCFDCDSLEYDWYDGLNVQVGGGRIYPSFNYDSDGSVNDISVFWAFERGEISETVAATGEADYKLASEATGAINSALFDTDRTAESFFANPYSLLPQPQGKALIPRFSNDTSIVVTNTSGREIPVTYVARDFDGTLISGDGIENPVTYTLSGGEQFSALPVDLFRVSSRTDRRPILADGAVGWMEVYSYEGDLQVMFIDTDRNGAALDGNIGAGSGGNPIVFTGLRLNDGESTEIELLNLAYDDIMVRLQLLDADGNVLIEEPEYFVFGSGIRSFALGGDSDFLRLDDPGLAAGLRVSCNNSNSIRSTSCSNIVGLATVTDRFGSLATAYAVSAESSGASLIGAYFVTGASGLGEWKTRVSVTKFDGQAGSVSLSLYDAQGNLLTVFPGTLSPGRRIEFILDGTTLPWGNRLTTGYLELQSDSGAISGDVSITWSDEAGSQLSIYPLSNRLDQALQFNRAAQGIVDSLYYWTGISIVNDLGKPIEVTVQIFLPDGSVDRTAVISLNPKGQVAALLPQLVGDPDYALPGGYIRLTSTDPFAAVVLYGDSTGKFLAAVPGIPR